jgi:glucose-6-phosphate isomerase
MLQKSNIPDIRALLRTQPERLERMVVASPNWRFDASRSPIELTAWNAFFSADALMPLQAAVEALFGGAEVNPSERQPALHMALRADRPASLCDPQSAAMIEDSRHRLLETAGTWYRGQTPVRHVLHAGIGGSDLGPRLVAEALDPGDSAVEVYWLGTLDGRRMARLLARLDPAATALVIASKSFSTVETLSQARAIRDWLGEGAESRIWAATANPARAREFGIAAARTLQFPSWTGGRFSLWSGVGLSAAARIGPQRWQALLGGAQEADRQLRSQLVSSPPHALARTLDMLVREFGLASLGVVCYAPELRLLAEFLQQLVMESLGKSVALDQTELAHPSAPLVFGGAGTDLQHSLFQALHQGTGRHPMLLLGSLAAEPGFEAWQREQLAHLLGQASALVHGRDDPVPERRLPGNNPVMTLLTERIDPASVGELIALFEHAVYLLSAIWRINAFDQWGVEEGKRLAGAFGQTLAGQGACPDPGLQPLLDWIRARI